MGAEQQPKRWEKQVQVELTKGLWMLTHEVTQEQWQRATGKTLSDQVEMARQERSRGGFTVGEGAQFPIYFVSHAEAIVFCQQLTETERAAGRLPSDRRFDLPTEAEWEFACRAGTATTYSFGEELTNLANCAERERKPSEDPLTPVKTYKANRFGLFDMHGNVAEWCLDRFEFNPLPGGKDPCSDRGKFVVVRGGAWRFPASACGSATRHHDRDNSRSNAVGFRFVIR